MVGGLKIKPVVEEYSRQCLTLEAQRSMSAEGVVEILLDRLFNEGGGPAYIRSDNGAEFIAEAIKRWLGGFRSNEPLHYRHHYDRPQAARSVGVSDPGAVCGNRSTCRHRALCRQRSEGDRIRTRTLIMIGTQRMGSGQFGSLKVQCHGHQQHGDRLRRHLCLRSQKGVR
jgi:hypothetical protein